MTILFGYHTAIPSKNVDANLQISEITFDIRFEIDLALKARLHRRCFMQGYRGDALPQRLHSCHHYLRA